MAMHLRMFGSLPGVLLVALLSLTACGGSATDPDEGLPPEFAIRSDVPYIRGPIVERTTLPGGELRIRVRVRSGVEARTPEAIATVLPNAIIRWANGDHGSRSDLRVGRVVTVWITGPELRSKPPQVSANGLILHRAFWR
jgi:hypothetical protein